MKDESLNKTVLYIAAPAVAELVLTALSQFVDTVMVGGIGAYAIAGIGITNQPRFVMLASFIALNVGTTALMARFKGANDKASADVVTAQSVLLTLVLAAVITVPGWLFARPMMQALGSTGEALEAATDYFRITALAFVPTALPLVISALLRGVGDTKIALRFNVTANAVNLVFDWLLIYGHFGFPALGVRGAAIATVMGNVSACVMAFAAISGRKRAEGVLPQGALDSPQDARARSERSRSSRLRQRLSRASDFVELKLERRLLAPNPVMLGRIVRVGLPSAGEQLALRVGLLIYTVTIAALGTTAFAAHQIALSILNLSFVIGQAYGIAAASLTGQALGRQDQELAKRAAAAARRQGTVIATAVGVLMFLLRHHVVYLFTREQEIVAMTAEVLILVALLQPFQSSFQVLSGALRGAGDSLYPALSLAFGILIIRPALSVVLVHGLGWGLMGAWWALLMDQSMRFAMIWLRFRTGKWTTLRV